jgi:hypothetical protein
MKEYRLTCTGYPRLLVQVAPTTEPIVPDNWSKIPFLIRAIMMILNEKIVQDVANSIYTGTVVVS